MHDRPKWVADGMIEAEKKYAQIIKMQNNTQNNSDIAAKSKDEYQVNICWTYVKVCQLGLAKMKHIQ